MEKERNTQKGAGGLGKGPTRARRSQPERGFHRRLVRSREKRGLSVGKTKCGKGTKIMAIADGHGLPIAIGIASASPHEVTLVEETVDNCFLKNAPDRLVGDMAYDSDELDERLLEERGIEMIAPNKRNRKVPTQDGRPLRRYTRRWKVERLFSWLQNFRRLTKRYELYAENFLGFLHLGCICILLRYL
jgi:transposase